MTVRANLIGGRLVAAALVAAVVGAPAGWAPSAMAGDLWWGGGAAAITNGTALSPSAGTWNTTISNWSTDASGTTYQTWDSVTPANAYLGATAGGYTISLSGSVGAGSLHVYDQSGTGTITLNASGASNLLTLSSGGTIDVASGLQVTIGGGATSTGLVATGGFTLSGGGILDLEGNVGNHNVGTSTLNINDGIFRVGSNNQTTFLSAATIALNSATSVFEVNMNGASSGVVGCQVGSITGTAGTIRTGLTYFTAVASLVMNNAGASNIDNLIIDGGNGGTLALVKQNTGTLTLTNTSNNWSGGTILSAGGITAGGAGSLPGLVCINAGVLSASVSGGVTGGVAVAAGGRVIAANIDLSKVQLLALSSLQFNSSADLPVAAASLSGAQRNAGFIAGYAIDQNFISKINPNVESILGLGANSANNLDFSAGGAGLSQARLTAWGTAATYSGALTPSGSTYRLGGGDNTLTLDTANTLSGANGLDLSPGTYQGRGPSNGTLLSSVLLLTATQSLSGSATVGARSTLTLQGSNGSLPNLTALALTDGATLNLVGSAAASNANRLPDALPIAIIRGGNLAYTAQRGQTEAVGALNLQSGFSTITATASGGSSGTAVLQFGGLTRTGSFGAAAFVANTNAVISFTTTPATPNGMIGGWAAYNTTGAGFASYSGTPGLGVIQATQTAVASDAAWTSSGTTAIVNLNTAFTATGPGGGGNVWAIRAASNLTWTFTGTTTIGSGGLLVVATNNTALNGGAFTSAATDGGLYIHGLGGAGTVTIGSALVDNGGQAVTVVKTGPAPVTLNNTANSFSGGLEIQQGTVTITGTNMPGSGRITLNGVGASLSVITASASYGNPITANTDASISIGSNSLTINLNGAITLNNGAIMTFGGINDGATLNLNGAISGNGHLRISTGFGSSARTVVMGGTAPNTYTGETFLQETHRGTFILAKPAGVTAIPGDLYIGSTETQNSAYAQRIVQLNNSDQIADSARIFFVGVGTADMAPVLRLNGFNETVAGLVGAYGDGIIESNATGVSLLTLNVTAGASYSYGGILRNDSTNNTAKVLSLVKNGQGTQTLAGYGGYSGTTTVNAGTLIVGSTFSTNNVLVSGGTLTLAQYGNMTTARVVLNGGALTAIGGNSNVGALVGSGTVTLGTASAGTNIQFGNNSGITGVFDGSIVEATPSNGSGILKFGSNTQTFNGNLSLSGTTTAFIGTLVFNGTVTSPVVIVNKILGGAGNLTGRAIVNNGGTIAPGASTSAGVVGTLSIAGGLTLSGTDTLALDLGPGRTSDLINLGGGDLSASFSTTLTLSRIQPGHFTLISFQSTNATLANFGPLPSFYQANWCNLTLSISGSALVLDSAGPEWQSTSAGNWTDGNKWTGGTAPVGVGAGSRFWSNGGNPGVNVSVQNAAVITGALSFDNTQGAYRIIRSGVSGALTLQVSSGSATIDVLSSAGTGHSIDVPVNLISNTTLTVFPGALLTMSGTLTGTTTTLSVAGGGGFGLLVNAGGTSNALLSISNTGSTTIGAGSALAGTATFSGGITLAASNLTLFASTGNIVAFTGIISGTGTLTAAALGTGMVRINGVNTFTGGLVQTGGVLQINNASALGANPAVATDSVILTAGTFSTTVDLALNVNRNVLVGPASGAGSVALDVASGHFLDTYGIVKNNAAGAGGITKTGPGTLSLRGTTTYTGPTNVSAGVLYLGTGVSLTASSTVTVAAGATFAGPGAALGAVSLSGTISPVDWLGIGSMGVGSLELRGAGRYFWEITDAAGTSGIDWDLVSVAAGAGTITLSQTAGNRFVIDPQAPVISHFNAAQSYAWKIIDASSLAGNSFSSSLFTVDSSHFGTSYTGTFSVSTAGGSIYLNYLAPITEANQWTAAGTGPWASGGNWTSSVPSTAGTTARLWSHLSTNNTGPDLVNTDQTVGTLSFSHTSRSYLVSSSGTGKLILDSGNASPATIEFTTTNTQSHAISANVQVASDLNVALPSQALTLSGALTINAGKTVTKTGAGTLNINGAQTHGLGSVLNVGTGSVSGGVVNFNAGHSNGYFGSASLANLTVNVDGPAGGTSAVVFNSNGPEGGSMHALRGLNVNVNAESALVVLGAGDPIDFGPGGSVMLQVYGDGVTPGQAPSRQVVENTWNAIVYGYVVQTLSGSPLSGITTHMVGNTNINTLAMLMVQENGDASGPTYLAVTTDILGDLNGDYTLTADDISIATANLLNPNLLTGLGANFATYLEGDMNGDETLTADDISIMTSNLINFGLQVYNPSAGVLSPGLDGVTAPGVSGVATTPEPATLVLLGLGAPGWLLLRRRNGREARAAA